jgi:hypothetical protein
MKKLLIIAVIFLFGANALHAQGELDKQQKVFFRNERSFGILLNSDGVGLSYREAKRVDYRNKWLLEFDGGTLKDQKEYKQSSQLTQGGSYIFGKLNSTFYLRAGLGRQHELYKKTDLGGIAVRYFYSAGPVIAILKPIYYKFLYLIPGTPNEYNIKEEKFDASLAAAQDPYGRASFFKGLNETTILPGLYAKAGFNFEYSKEDKIIHAVEFGGQLNAFPKRVPIMAISNNKALFFSLFVSYRFGMILDPLDPESNKLSNIFRRKKND